MKPIFFVLLAALLALAGCSPSLSDYDQSLQKTTAGHEAEVEFAKNYLAKIQAHDLAGAEADLDATFKNGQIDTVFQQMASVFPADAPINIKLIGFAEDVFVTPQSKITKFALSFEYEFPDRWLAGQVVLTKNGAGYTVLGVHVDPLADSLENINRFTMAGRGAGYFIMLALCALVPVFILAVLVICIRTPIPKRKWLWIVFVMFGFVSVSLDWSTGSIHINPVYFLLFGSGFSQSSPYSPVILSVAFPLGAMVFLLKRKKWPKATLADKVV